MKAEFHGVVRAAAHVDAPDWASAFAPGAASPTVRSARARVAAGWTWQQGARGVCARRSPLLWDGQAGRFTAWDDARGDELLDAVVHGRMLVASDDLLLLWEGDRVSLRSSASGGSVVYWTPVRGGWAFAQAIPLLAAAAAAPVDPVGVAELSRFGASYASRTVLAGIQRLPAAHALVLDGAAPAVRPFVTFASRPEPWREADARAAIGARLTQLADVVPAARHVMYSGGVDSSLLGQIFRAGSPATVGVNLALRAGDPEVVHARRIAKHIGLEVVGGTLDADPARLVRTIGSYAAPTLDFSIVPTHLVGELARAHGAATLIDGTGGDAWFGFGALGNEPVWRRIHHAWPLRAAAARLYGRLALVRDHRAWQPLKVVARAPRRADAALAHLCASPLYDVVWKLPRAAWDAAEREVGATLDALLGDTPQEPWQRMVVADGLFIAGGAFAAKSGEWSLVREQATLYPFLTPGLVDVARRLPREMMLRKGLAKPLLKDLAVDLGIPREEIFRRKSGFQPPLAALMRDPAVRADVERRFAAPHELDALMAPGARRVVERVLRAADRPSIHVLYPFWNVLSLRCWLDELRSGAAARQWCR